MTTESLSKEVETRLKDFFIDVIDAKDMAKTIREVNYVLSLCSMRGCETIESEIKSLKESLAAIAETAKKDAANARIKNLEARLLTKDVTATVWASFALSVAPAPQKTP